MASWNTVAEVVSEQFPVGLRVLVVDDHMPCLRIIEQMLRKCKYSVTTCSQAASALNLLRERKGCFDIVLSDVHMPDMDGFKLLELVGLEIGLPVIMMSSDGRTNLVMRGVKHGACDYLIKPIREEQLKNIWQHVVRRRTEIKEHERSRCLKDNESASVNRGDKKRKYVKDEDETELECNNSNAGKRARVVWSAEMHKQFAYAVNHLGLDKAVPKRVLELMNAPPGLTRENVASHLQKFRLCLKRLLMHSRIEMWPSKELFSSMMQSQEENQYGLSKPVRLINAQPSCIVPVSLTSGLSGASLSCTSTNANCQKNPILASTFVAPRQGSYNINRGTSFPNRFAVTEPGLLLSSLNHGVACGENNGSRIKMEQKVEHNPASDLMSVLSDLGKLDLMSVLSD